ncbi:MAG: hypothetical protein ACKVY0_19710 [Prosthecobacter sp.]|uniref:hypothetical protein n=1 Tax=Prosthecobacter sp. TaxID=1965333 RepID=UPI0038FFC596
MLASRSARLAATLLLALLLGWTVRAYRKGEAPAPLVVPAPLAAPIEETPKTAFPDE